MATSIVQEQVKTLVLLENIWHQHNYFVKYFWPAFPKKVTLLKYLHHDQTTQ